MVVRASGNQATAQEPPSNVTAKPTPVKQPEKTGRAGNGEAKARAAEQLPITPPSPTTSFSEDVRSRIAQAAYYRALERGFAPGQEVEDWLEAEASILNRND
jgi:hypothetical protein